MRIGYARVSTADQNPDLQEDALQKTGCEKIFRDVASGAVDSRRGLAEFGALAFSGADCRRLSSDHSRTDKKREGS